MSHWTNSDDDPEHCLDELVYHTEHNPKEPRSYLFPKVIFVECGSWKSVNRCWIGL